MVLEQWPMPRPLAGVKSRKRAVFEVPAGAALPISGNASVVSAIMKLTLNSRVAAAGDAGHALTELLLGRLELAQGEVFRNEGLVVAHLGPHLSGGCTLVPPRVAWEAAVDAALARQPQVVVLDEARGSGNEAWAHTFNQLLCSEALRTFRGAVVVRTEVQTPAVQRACAEYWALEGQRLRQLDLIGDINANHWGHAA
mmetsp:Transcript_36999/g.73221  ORF Transcript_36999/g.73221 Transcript_36999/m.73221 type:complete len:198 (+) Transcript_36999:102-695(+)